MSDEQIFNPFAGGIDSFSTAGFIADTDDYVLMIADVIPKIVGTDTPRKILEIRVRFSGGVYDGKFSSPITVFDPDIDFSVVGRVLVAACGFIPGKQDKEWAAEYGSKDFSLNYSVNPPVAGSGYEEMKGRLFMASLGKKHDAKAGIDRQTFKNIRPLDV